MALTSTQLDMAAIIKPIIDGNAEGVNSSPKAYIETLPKDNPLVTAETVDAVLAHRNDFIVAFTHAAGEVAVENTLKNNPDVGFVTTSANFACDTVENITHRCKTYPAAPGSDEKVVKYGVSRTSYTTLGAENKGTLKQTYAHIAVIATEALA